jgi:cysteine desulfurase
MFLPKKSFYFRTESNNWSAVVDLKVKRIITSKIEHHAVLETVLTLQKDLQVDFVAVKPNGAIDLTNLVELLSQDAKTMVSLMHVNNEIGTVLDLERGIICNEHQVLFHQIPCNLLVKYVLICKQFMLLCG